MSCLIHTKQHFPRPDRFKVGEVVRMNPRRGGERATITGEDWSQKYDIPIWLFQIDGDDFEQWCPKDDPDFGKL